MYSKIFVNEKPIYLADHNNNTLQHKINEGFIFYDNNTNLNYLDIVQQLSHPQVAGIVILQKDLTQLQTEFKAAFKIIEAGGGIVQNEAGEILFIYRLNKWDLPKGKLEKGETIEFCAQREVEEETGVTNLTLKSKIGETYHIYQEKGEQILKVSHWYHFTCPSHQNTIAQTEENITEVKWVAIKNIQEPLENTYNNIREILGKFMEVI
jgi:8-oxo-dGTP pyrophosphatase MutT (NUDIX family)